ncbi:MAG: alkaline phosphatase D family protein [Cyclobacteriaceae bacterium]
MMRNLIYPIILVVISCSPPQQKTTNSVQTIAFGSCSVQGKIDAQLWNEVIAENPALWIWLGDNIYADTEDMEKMKADYDLQKSHPDYQTLLGKMDVIGVWDDHDFGNNDLGSEYPKKDESRDLLFDFLDVPEDSEAWNRKGAYQSYTYTFDEKKLKVILLDVRYFRDSLKWTFDPKTALINEDGAVLGEEQWSWLADELSDDEIDLFLVGSGIQVLPQDHRFEKWANFPKERKKLLNLVAEKVKVPLAFLSGDRHISEVSKLEIEGYGFPIYDITSSSLTNPWAEEATEANKLRVGSITYPVNFAVVDIDWSGDQPSMQLKFVGQNSKILQKIAINY